MGVRATDNIVWQTKKLLPHHTGGDRRVKASFIHYMHTHSTPAWNNSNHDNNNLLSTNTTFCSPLSSLYQNNSKKTARYIHLVGHHFLCCKETTPFSRGFELASYCPLPVADFFSPSSSIGSISSRIKTIITTISKNEKKRKDKKKNVGDSILFR